MRDGASSLPALLESLASQDLADERYEVIVVDNASRDDSARIADSFGAKVVFEPVPNRSRARNAGIRVARAPVVTLIDADCTASPTWLSALLACRGRAPLLAGPVEIQTRTPPGLVERFESAWRFDQRAGVAHGWAATANLLVERAAFDAVGGFDAEYRHIGEDVDFCLRAGRAGFELGFCEGAIVYHPAEAQLGPLMRRSFFHGYSAAQTSRRVGLGHVAWRHPRPLLSPRAATEWHGISGEEVDDRRRLAMLASATYASRVLGSLWASIRGAD